MMLNKKRHIVLIVLISMGMFACGYKFSGGGVFPGGIRSISVALFENRTSETGLEHTITNDIIYEITRNKKVFLKDADTADAVLSGVINMDIETISHKGQSSRERRVTVKIDAQLTTPDGKVIWRVKNISVSEEYDEKVIKQATEEQRKIALAALSERLAESFYNRLTEDF